MNHIHEISKINNAHAHEYEALAKVQTEIGRRLFERLHYLKINPKTILDLGCGPGIFLSMLKKRYPKALIIGVDIAEHMLKQAKLKQSFRRKWSLTAANMTQLPFASGLFDLVFANQVIHYSSSLSCVFNELSRVMAKDACLMFSTLGPDTFMELRGALSQDSESEHKHALWDMHDIGDALQQQYFQDPVVDMERLTACYGSEVSLMHSLRSQGVLNLMMPEGVCTAEGKYPITYEIIYGHAWKGSQRRTSQGIETTVSLSELNAHRKEKI